MNHDIDQGSAAWHQIRLGKATASRMADICAKTKSGPAATRKAYLSQLVRERLLGVPEDTYCNAAMQWGTEKEPEAREAYARYMLCTVEEVGFVDHQTIPNAGCSPDGMIGTDGLVELKCPTPQTHQDILLGKSFPDRYVKQALWQMACTGRAYCDLATYDPRWPEPMRLFVQRIDRDEALIAELEAEVTAFLAEVDETVAKLRAAYEPQKEAA